MRTLESGSLKNQLKSPKPSSNNSFNHTSFPSLRIFVKGFINFSFFSSLYSQLLSDFLLPPSPRGQLLCNLHQVRRVAVNTAVSYSKKSRDCRRLQSEFAFSVGDQYALTSCQSPPVCWLLDLAARRRFPGQLL